MPPVKQPQDAVAAKLAAAEQTIVERDRQLAEQTQRANDAEAKATQVASAAAEQTIDRGEIGKYVVLGAGAAFNDPDGNIRLAIRRRVIDLDEVEAARLLALGTIGAASDDDLSYEQVEQARELANQRVVAPEGSANPYGGKPLQDLGEHAAQEIARAQQAARAVSSQ